MSICRMGESGLVIRLAHAQCSDITEDGNRVFPRPGPYLMYLNHFSNIMSDLLDKNFCLTDSDCNFGEEGMYKPKSYVEKSF